MRRSWYPFASLFLTLALLTVFSPPGVRPSVVMAEGEVTATSLGRTTRVSVASDGTQGDSWSEYPSISADGRYVAFSSGASNLISNDTNDVDDVFVHDRFTGETTRVSVASDGTQANARSGGYPTIAISADGRYVAFLSGASNLVPDDTNGRADVFVHDRESGETTRVSVGSDGTQGNDHSWYPSISADGRYVAFSTSATNLVPDANDGIGYCDGVLVHDRLTGETIRASIASDGSPVWFCSTDWPDISADGRYVAFNTDAYVGPCDTNGVTDVFVHDLLTGETSCASISADGTTASGGGGGRLSANGRYVAFYSWAGDLVADDTNNVDDVFVHDRLTGETTRVSLSSDGAQSNGRSVGFLSISTEGRYVAFISYASNLVSDDTNDACDVFVHDRTTGDTRRVSVSSEGVESHSPYCASMAVSISGDGSNVAFDSSANDLIPDDTNGSIDVFVHTMGEYSSSDVIEAIDVLASETPMRLDQLLDEAWWSAQDGDYFSTELKGDEVAMVVDTVWDSVGLLAEGVDVADKARNTFKVSFPALQNSGWDHIIEIKQLYEPAAQAFREELLQPIGPGFLEEVTAAFLSGAHFYFAADFLDSAATHMTKDLAEDTWRSILVQEDRLQQQTYPALERLVDEAAKLDITATHNEVISNLPVLDPQLEEAYVKDLDSRRRANLSMLLSLQRRGLPLHIARQDRESGDDFWTPPFLATWGLKVLLFIPLDGPGVLLVEGASAISNAIENFNALETDTRMMALGSQMMVGSFEVTRKIQLNTVQGMLNVRDGIAPQLPEESVLGIVNRSVGNVKCFLGICWWVEEEAYSDVLLDNSGSSNTISQALVNYESSGFLGTGLQLLLTEGIREIPASGSGTVRVYYRQGAQGRSPDQDSWIGMDILATTNTGTYFIDRQYTSWDPDRVNSSGGGWRAAGLSESLQVEEELPILANPVGTTLMGRSSGLDICPTIWLENPFSQTVAVTVTQPLVADLAVVDSNDGTMLDNAVRWQVNLEPDDWTVLTATMAYQGPSGVEVAMPAAQVEMTDLSATDYVTFTGNVITFTTKSPLVATAKAITELSGSDEATIPITVTNRSTLESVDGIVRMFVIDQAGSEVYATEMSVAVPPSGQQVVSLPLSIDAEPGWYVVRATVGSNGGTYPIFSEFLRLWGHPVYLPLIMRND